jgi:hypothetical protein
MRRRRAWGGFPVVSKDLSFDNDLFDLFDNERDRSFETSGNPPLHFV